MAIIKCKMCGGDIELNENMTLGTCEYCGSTMTLPKVSDEQRAAAFNRGNYFRRVGDFDKALAVYERIVSEDDTDAEAHWCCALCRFGIEYVEDPDSHEWLPTCHRASFDSILEDVDYKAAVEHSSGRTARRYTVEAEKIAEVQRGILRLSQSEQPFDVFICYKETDENGERTKDSTLAQDIYYQLTDKGLRVFFARITLEDKAGTQYEPYIFAALNSAKVMVVVGTKAEYVNAVWVKNEWSRFFSLMKRDRSKLLLPCYRDMNPYDLPEQLSDLQAYDMSKIGFMQDLIRGIEKVLGREKPQAQKETVVVRGGANGSALVKRGNMALTDGDWQAADGFFERVLDEDAESGEAFLGKFLAGKRRPALDAYLDDQLSQTKRAQSQTTHLSALEPDKARIQAAVERYEVPGYLSKDEIEGLFRFDRVYDSAVQALKAEKDRRLKALDEDKLFSRAVRFAQGGFKATLDASLQRFRVELDRRISEAEAQDAENVKRISEAYAQHVAQVERELPQRYEQALAQKQEDKEERIRREEEAKRERIQREAQEIEDHYQTACRFQQNAKYASEMELAAKDFESLGDYKDSAQHAEVCKERAARMRREEERKQKKAHQKKTAIICLIVAVIVAAVVVTQVVIPSIHYKEAEALLSQGDFDGAVAAFEAAGGYQDATERVLATRYAKAEALLAKGDYDGAIGVFEDFGDYEDAAARILQVRYAKAEALLADGQKPAAAMAFAELGNYQDARARSMALWDEFAEKKTLDAGGDHTVGLKSDGTVVAVGRNNYGQCDVSGWSDIVAVVATGEYHTVGLKSDGTVVAVGRNDAGQCEVSNWSDIVAVAAGSSHTVGLKSDSTVVAVGEKTFGQCDVGGWTDIVAVAAGFGHTVGLKSDGMVVAVGDNSDSQCDVDGWTDIVAVAAGSFYTVGLKSDGTVVATGWNDYGQCDVEGWTDIVAVAANNGSRTVGLKSDGTVVAVGYNFHGQCNVEGWTDIVAVAACDAHTVGLRSDGTVVAVGSNDDGQCDVSGWTDIKLPANAKK